MLNKYDTNGNSPDQNSSLSRLKPLEAKFVESSGTTDAFSEIYGGAPPIFALQSIPRLRKCRRFEGGETEPPASVNRLTIMAVRSAAEKPKAAKPVSSKWPKYLPLLGILTALLAVISVNRFPFNFDSLFIRKLYDQFANSPKEDVLDVGGQERDVCLDHRFTSVKQLSRAPDIILIEGFLSPMEAEALIRVAYNLGI
jgi:hypothetical protein